jgi:hypothetical protein
MTDKPRPSLPPRGYIYRTMMARSDEIPRETALAPQDVIADDPNRLLKLDGRGVTLRTITGCRDCPFREYNGAGQYECALRRSKTSGAFYLFGYDGNAPGDCPLLTESILVRLDRAQ